MDSAADARQRRLWDRIAPVYDARIAWLERRLLGASRRWVAARASGHTLEVAIGTGLTLPHYDAGVRVTGLERSRPMLDEARRRAATLRRPVEFVVGDAHELPFAAASFDAVVCTYALCGVADERLALREMLRVLRPGGALLLADHVESTQPLLRAGQRILDAVSVPLEGEHFSRRPVATLQELGVPLVASERLHQGIIERVHATRSG